MISIFWKHVNLNKTNGRGFSLLGVTWFVTRTWVKQSRFGTALRESIGVSWGCSDGWYREREREHEGSQGGERRRSRATGICNELDTQGLRGPVVGRPDRQRPRGFQGFYPGPANGKFMPRSPMIFLKTIIIMDNIYKNFFFFLKINAKTMQRREHFENRNQLGVHLPGEGECDGSVLRKPYVPWNTL